MEEKMELENCQAVEELLDAVEDSLMELFESGFSTIYESTLNGIRECEKQAEQIGLAVLSEKLSGLVFLLEQSRHQMKRETGEMLEFYGQIYQYITICREKTQLDTALCYYG